MTNGKKLFFSLLALIAVGVIGYLSIIIFSASDDLYRYYNDTVQFYANSQNILKKVIFSVGHYKTLRSFAFILLLISVFSFAGLILYLKSFFFNMFKYIKSQG